MKKFAISLISLALAAIGQAKADGIAYSYTGTVSDGTMYAIGTQVSGTLFIDPTAVTPTLSHGSISSGNFYEYAFGGAQAGTALPTGSYFLGSMSIDGSTYYSPSLAMGSGQNGEFSSHVTDYSQNGVDYSTGAYAVHGQNASLTGADMSFSEYANAPLPGQPALPPAMLLAYSTWGAGTSNYTDVSISSVSPVPEPSTWLLTAGGLLAMTLVARRRSAF